MGGKKNKNGGVNRGKKKEKNPFIDVHKPILLSFIFKFALQVSSTHNLRLISAPCQCRDKSIERDKIFSLPVLRIQTFLLNSKCKICISIQDNLYTLTYSKCPTSYKLTSELYFWSFYCMEYTCSTWISISYVWISIYFSRSGSCVRKMRRFSFASSLMMRSYLVQLQWIHFQEHNGSHLKFDFRLICPKRILSSCCLQFVLVISGKPQMGSSVLLSSHCATLPLTSCCSCFYWMLKFV